MNLHDEIEYPSRPYRKTHPDSMAALGILFGLDPPDPASSRVLEVGCGLGGNLIPMAASMPGAAFLGFDLAHRPIEAANRRIGQLDLSNIRALPLDIADFPDDAGEFDYIIAHGFYSWVPHEARQALWRMAQRHLSPRGILYLSFNAYPGSMIRRIWRDAAMFHTRAITEPVERAKQSAAMVGLMARARQDQSPMTGLTKEMDALIRARGFGVVSHDDFGPCFAPFYFHEVMGHAAEAGFEFLTESEYAEAQMSNLQPQASAMLDQISDPVAREQYFDFIELRSFRQPLFCRRGLPRSPAIGNLARLEFSSCAQITETDGELEIQNPENGVTAAATPAHARMVQMLSSAWPSSVPFADLARAAGPETAELAHQLWASGVLDAHATPRRCGRADASRPVAFPLARLQASLAEPVSTLLHDQIRVGPEMLALIQKLDGTADRAALASEAPDFEDRLRWLESVGLLVA